ncbi:hypothetical protein D9611_003793 [Ephemerocybe angulata]|uniref:Uncharacterized protein n=1 Tax=Ephemerocybe angulata TaxID=980116 RepID=A0A8H5EYH6_9AGAR|nr:hypothetical protein D9611_003793 [Tulosesus angulatus]
MSKPAIIRVSTAEEDDVTRHPHPARGYYDDSIQRRPSRKGKEKEIETWSADTRESSPVDFSQNEALTGSQGSSYPPVNDEEEETRRIQENLKRWEQAELQRRKAARQSTSISSTGGAAPSSLVENVSRRASLLWNKKRGSGTHKGHSSSKSRTSSALGQHAKLPSTDDLHDLQQITDTPVADSPTHSPVRSDTDADSLNTVTDVYMGSRRQREQQEPMDDPFNPPEDFQHEHIAMSPFSDPQPMTPGADQTTALVGSSSRQDEGNTNAGSTTRQPPPPMPLGLPRPKTPPPPIDSPEAVRQRAGAEDDDAQEETTKTKWWHEWLCGCGEGPDRGGDHQAGKPNPYE